MPLFNSFMKFINYRNQRFSNVTQNQRTEIMNQAAVAASSDKPWTMNNIIDDEASKDPGIEQTTQGYTEKDFEGHRAHTVFVGVHVPGSRRHSHRRHKHHHKDGGEREQQNDADRPRPNPLIVPTPRPRALSISGDGEISITPPAQRVQFILGEEIEEGNHESHPLFSEMEELVKDGGDGLEWKETARWIKFEEDVEEGGNRWSKPHVATLSLHALFELRSFILNGTVMLDMEASTLEQISDLICDNMVNAGTLPSECVEKVRDALLRRHRHQHEKDNRKGQGNNMSRLPIIRSLADIGKNHSSSKNMQQAQSTTNASPSSHSFLHATEQSSTSIQNNEDNLHNSPTPALQTGLLNQLFSKDQRGSYLAVPTGDIIFSSSSHIGNFGVTTWFHSGSASAPNVIPSADKRTSYNTTTPTTAAASNNNLAKVEDQLLHQPSSWAGTLKTGNNDSGKFLSIPGKNNSTPYSLGEDLVKSPSSVSMNRNTSSNELMSEHKGNTHFMRKIPQGAEASNILVGEVDFLDKTLSAFIRLSQAAIMGDLTEVPVPTRFLFILLGPPGSHGSYHEVGRAMATLMSDEIFHEVAYRAKKRDHLLSGIDEFLDAVTVLPPGEWDPTIRIEPPAAIPSQEERKHPKEKSPKEEVNEEVAEAKQREESGLSRSGKLFGGLINDIKRKTPFYLADFKDALALQCVASWIFLYFACLSPIITFGGLLSEATEKNMAAMESLVSGFVCGIGYGFFSGQPLTILGSTGPVLVFETIVFEFCKKVGWKYISFRFWIGTWISLILLILVAVDASALVCYITRFTEENFATLIAFIFIYKAVENVLQIGTKFPINFNDNFNCTCLFTGNTTYSQAKTYSRALDVEHVKCMDLGGVLIGSDCNVQPAPNVFLMSVILFLGTFLLSIILKDFKNSLFFPANVRQFISDFSVIIAIFSMSILDFWIGVDTPKLEVPHEFKPTLPDRGWLIKPMDGNPLISCIVAIVPALLGTILIFMDQQITAVIINRKENKLKKGCGYHLDLFVLAILIQICSIMGLPWFVAATVLSINHVNSLKLESECAAPGEKPQFLGVREQRVTHILIFLMIGCSVLLTPILCHIPMPVLFGVFLYMGVASLKGLQFFDRILILLMPPKYQPDYMFLRQVPIKRVHLFTLIQFTCLVVLWLIKSFQFTSILFPLMLVVMIAIRKSLDCVFTRRELKILDDIMPEMIKREAADDMCQLEDGSHGRSNGGANGEGGTRNPDDPPPYSAAASTVEVPLPNGNVLRVPNKSINITEEVNRTTIWKQLNDEKSNGNNKFKNGDSTIVNLNIPHKRKSKNPDKKHSKKDLSPNDEKRLSTMAEETEEYTSSLVAALTSSTGGDDNQTNRLSSNLNNSQVNSKKEFWSETKVNPKDVGNAAETSV